MTSEPRRREGPAAPSLRDRLPRARATAQAAIPGVYAWAMTVFPVAWAKGAGLAVRGFAALGVLLVVAAPLLEARLAADGASVTRRLPGGARALSLWGLVVPSAAVWALASITAGPPKLDVASGALGVVGWALFAFASAGPALRPVPEGQTARVLDGAGASGPAVRGDGVYVAVGVAMALGLQLVGWNVAVVERAVLVRLVTLAAGVAVLSAATDVALARHRKTRRRAPQGRRLRRAIPWLLLASFAVALGWIARALDLH